MKPLALIVDDNPEILDLFKDRVESMGHDYRLATSQSEAIQLLQSHLFAYVLLDLELPVRPGRPPSQHVGKNLLAQIKEDARNHATPVLVITSHGNDTPVLAVDLMKGKGGAEDFLNKPCHDLEKRIREALREKQHQPSAEGTAPKMTALNNAQLVFTPEGAEVQGIPVCNSSSRAYRILKELSLKRNSKRPSMSGKALADALNEDRGEAAITEAVSGFRKQAVKRMAEANLHVAEDAIIITTSAGYSLNPGIQVDTLSGSAMERDPGRITQEQRQQWLLDELKKGRRIRRPEYQGHFHISEPTAKRDLAGLRRHVKFVGAGVSGYYSLVADASRQPASPMHQ